MSTNVNLDYIGKFTQTIPINGYILLSLPFIDQGFFSQASNVICKVQTVVYSCKLYPSVQWILITITTSIVPTGVTPTITLQNLLWPRYVYTPTDMISSTILKGTTFEDLEVVSLTNFVSHAEDGYTKAEVNVDRKQYNSVGCFYEFLFKAKNDIPYNSEIYLTFPSIYNLLSSPLPWLEAVNLPSSTNFTVVNLMVVKFKILADITKNTDFSFKIGGVKNPGFGSASTGWSIQAKLNGYLLNSHSTFTVNFVLSGIFSASKITINSIQASPTNKNVEADYKFDFVTNINYNVYSSAEIFLIFPSNQFLSLPVSPSCSVSSGMNYYKTMQNSGSSYLVTTIQPLANTSQQIQFFIKGIKNPPSIGLTDSFSIIILYDGTIISQTDTSKTYSILITDSPFPIVLSSVSLIPINEGEITKILVSFDLSHTLTNNMIIKLIFPDSYSAKLTNENSIKCTGKKTINTILTCGAENRVLTIQGISQTFELGTIVILIENLVNPNYLLNSNTGYFSLAVQSLSSTQYQSYLDNAEFFTISQAPQYCFVWNITISNYYSRLEADYSFNVTFYTKIPTLLSLGKIYIEFPSEYDIPDNANLGCTVSSLEYGTPSCMVSQNIAIIQGNIQEFSGNLLIVLQKIKNPTNIGSVGQFRIYSFDGYANKILERSFTNFGTFSFSFVLKGKPVLVNNDEAISIQVGTESESVSIVIDEPSILNLTFKPMVTGFSIIPASITLSAGTISSSFNIAIPEGLAVGTYYILWETFNDPNLLFTPLKKTTILVVNTLPVSISISPIYSIPYTGESVPITFSMKNPPYSQVIVNIAFENSTIIKAAPSSLIFTLGVFELTTVFTPTSLALTSLVASVNVVFSLSGTNKASYNLASASTTITFVSTISQNPQITAAVISDITRTTANLQIQTDRPVTAYYMIALAGTSTPTYNEVSDLGPPRYLTTESTYAKYVVHGSSSIILKSLLAGKNYTVYIYVKDQNLLTAGPKVVNFQTTSKWI